MGARSKVPIVIMVATYRFNKLLTKRQKTPLLGLKQSGALLPFRCGADVLGVGFMETRCHDLCLRLMTLSSKLNRARDERVKIVTEALA